MHQESKQKNLECMHACACPGISPPLARAVCSSCAIVPEILSGKVPAHEIFEEYAHVILFHVVVV